MIRPARVTAAAVALALALVAPAAAQDGAQPRARVSVAGVGEVAAVPDMAVVVLGAAAEARRAEDAASAAAARAAAILAALEAEGVEARDVRTVEISLAPTYARPGEDARRRLDGYAARHRLRVTLRRIEALGPVIDAAVGAGADIVESVSFDVADRAALVAEARRRAVADAEAAATLLAEAAGRSRGAAVSLALEGGFGAQPELRGVAAMADSPTPIAPGEITVRETVSAVYALDD